MEWKNGSILFSKVNEVINLRRIYSNQSTLNACFFGLKRNLYLLYYAFFGVYRARYLKLRNEKDPEDKYNFKFPSSWDYGWYFKEMVKMDEIKKPYHHSDIIKNTLFNRNKIPLEGIDEIVQKKRFV